MVLVISLNPFTAGIVALALSDSAFEAERFRAGIQSIDAVKPKPPTPWVSIIYKRGGTLFCPRPSKAASRGGETTEIGNRVIIFQGVSQGALSIPSDFIEQFRNKKRHPTIEDDEIIYSNAALLGGETVIGSRSRIGGNVCITDSIPPVTKVMLKRPELVYFENNNERLKKPGNSKIAKLLRNVAKAS